MGVALLWLALGGIVGAESVSAQAGENPGWTVLSARLAADLTGGDGSATVTVVYRLEGTPRGAPLPTGRPLRVTLLEMDAASVSAFSVNGGRPVALSTTQGRQRAADVIVPAGAAGEELLVELEYRVDGAVVADGAELRARIPVLAAPSAPASGDGGGFEARVAVPPGWRIAEGFPSGLRRDGDGTLTAGLQVIPAFVGFRARSDGVWRPGLPLIVDLIILGILGAFSAVGFRHLRGVVS